jgi:hypothetical protein
LELPADVVVDEAFRWDTLGEQHIVLGELDMEIVDAARHWPLGDGGLQDRAAVDQTPGRHQGAVDQQPMARRDPEVGLRQALLERARFDADRQDLGVGGDECCVIAAAADPDDARVRALLGDHQVTDRQRLDRAFAAIGQNARARTKTQSAFSTGRNRR